MANSYIEYSPSTGPLSIAGLNYISDTHLKAAGKVYSDTSYTPIAIASKNLTASPPTVTLASFPNSFSTIRVYRDSGLASLVDFQSGSRITESDLDTGYQHALFAAQEVLENAPGNALAQQGQAGAAGVGISNIGANKVGLNTTVTITKTDGSTSSFVISDGAAGSAGAAGTDGANGSLQTSFESAETAIPATQTKLELTHSLGTTPTLFQWVLRCKSAENGYATGDEIDLSAQGHSAGRLGLYANATKCFFVYDTKLTLPVGDATSTWDVTNADTNWKLICRAFA